MNAYNALILLSGLVIFSYLFDLFARRTRIPSVLLLLALGIGLRAAAERWQVHVPAIELVLPTLGNVGLILIVFEGALELTYEHSKRPLIRQAFFSALVLLLLTTAGIAVLLHALLPEASWAPCIANAVPLSVISSAVAIPSASGLRPELKEFVVYESSFSDILAIVLFNFITTNVSFGTGAFGRLGLEVLVVLALSAGFSMALLWLLGRIKHRVKFFLILAILVLVYAVGKQFHLSSLIVVLAFGIFLANVGQVPLRWFRARFLYPDLDRDLEQFHSLARESAFLIRTFFFVLFGFSVVVARLADADAAWACGAILLVAYALRTAFIALLRRPVLPLAFMAPRGLITILLYLSLPAALRLPQVHEVLLFLVVLASCILMALGLLAGRKEGAGAAAEGR